MNALPDDWAIGYLLHRWDDHAPAAPRDPAIYPQLARDLLAHLGRPDTQVPLIASALAIWDTTTRPRRTPDDYSEAATEILELLARDPVAPASDHR